ncbi:hypothetical protein BJF80_15090 [Serinicoccus sp. CUA-874]|uniref:hypothetical protein n=1 Tax=Serinicoccus sp. CUA-874 TaxID=1517939 RepID=UPI00096045A3|nr:hypothetical protein [Serinicoccus sp. CUA-874]OLT18437.1 hypothetical protein BJF80_15090 [Serinicoccus sp. CUA-874]
MDQEVVALLEAQGGAGAVHQLLGAGCSRRTVERLVRTGVLVRVRRDALVLATALRGITPWERRALRARAVGFSLAHPRGGADPAVHALSHQSAFAVREQPYGGGGEDIHLSRLDGHRGRRDGAVWVHAPVPATWAAEEDGLLVVHPAMAALQVAAASGPESGLICLDGVLHSAALADAEAHGQGIDVVRRGGVPPGREMVRVGRQLEAALSAGFGRGRPAAEQVVEAADARSESPGESRSRWLVEVLGLGPCTPQFAVRDGSVLVGYADLKLDRWAVLLEFDGSVKYSGLDDLLSEKEREDRLRELGYEVVRITWADLARPHLVRQRILAAIARAEARRAVPG